MKKILSFLLIFSLFSFGVNNLAKASFVVADASQTGYSSAQKISLNTASIQVINTPIVKLPSIVTVNNQSSKKACNLSLAGSNDLLQSAAEINLNQPANCFSLELDKSAAPVSNLSVLPLAASIPLIVVVKAGAVITSANIAQEPLTQNTPILPLAAVFVLIARAVWDKKILGAKLLSIAQTLKFSLTLHQLQMLRC